MPSFSATPLSSSQSASSRRPTRQVVAGGLCGCKGGRDSRPAALARPATAGYRRAERRARAMVKSILVALDGSQHADSALEYGLWLARRMRARLIGLHVLDIVSIEGSFLHDVSGSLGFEPYLDFSSKMREALQERGNVLLDAFRTKCEQAGVPCETSL